MTNRSTPIALVISFSLAYCRGVLRGIQHFARTRREWTLIPVTPGPEVGATVAAIKARGIIAHIFNRDLATALSGLRKPLVNVSGIMVGLTIPRVGVDDRVIGQLAARHFLDSGLRSFAGIGHPDHQASIQRAAGFRDALAAVHHDCAHYDIDPALPFVPAAPIPMLDRSVQSWLRSLPKPVGVFAFNDVIGLQLTEACRQAGLAVPEEVALLGVDNDDLLCELARPGLSSIAVPAEAVGFQAASALDRALRGEEPLSTSLRRPLLLPPVGVVVRQSSDVLAVADAGVAAAMRVIREHAHRPLTVADVLRQVPTNRRTLERRFRSCLGRGLWEEIRRVHLERAKELLAGSDLDMVQIAERSGFTGGKQLSVVFRQALGVTPTAYRRRLRAGA